MRRHRALQVTRKERVIRSAFVGVSLAILLAFAGQAAAQSGPAPGSPQARGQATALLAKTKQRYDAGDCTEASNLAQQAEALHHHPANLLYLARCRAKDGHLREARDLYTKITAEALDASAGPQARDAQSDAKKELDEVAKKIPSLAISVDGSLASSAQVSVDDAPVDKDKLSRVELDPGSHTVKAVAEGADPVTQTVKLEVGGSEKVALTLEPRPAAAPPPPPPPPPAPPPPPPSGGGSFAPAIVAFGVGVVGLGFGAVTGAMSLSKVGDLQSRCDHNHCLASDASEGDTASLLATMSNVGFIVGGVGVAAGVVLLIVRPGHAKAETTSAHTQGDKVLRARIGPRGASLVGTF